MAPISRSNASGPPPKQPLRPNLSCSPLYPEYDWASEVVQKMMEELSSRGLSRSSAPVDRQDNRWIAVGHRMLSVLTALFVCFLTWAQLAMAM